MRGCRRCVRSWRRDFRGQGAAAGRSVRASASEVEASTAQRAAAGVDEAFAYDYDRNDRLIREREDADYATAQGYDSTTFYEYDNPNGVGGALDGTERTAVRKFVGDHATQPASGVTVLSESTYEYDLRGRMKKAIVDSDGDGQAETTSEYAYNDGGIRISQTVDDGSGPTTTHYNVDGNNHTGYAQVLEEKQDVGADGLDDDDVTKSYVIGHDVLAAAAEAAQAMFLLADGHGSTRMILDAAAQIVENVSAGNVKQLFSYDAYGNLVVAPALVAQIENAVVNLLYSGEQTDWATGLQYLRARYYSSLTGTFNRTDPFGGNQYDPQSLHKYLYTHGNPIDGVDPSGEFLQFVFYYFAVILILALRPNFANAPAPGDFTYADNSGDIVIDLGFSLVLAPPFAAAGRAIGRYVVMPAANRVSSFFSTFSGPIRNAVPARMARVVPSKFFSQAGRLGAEKADDVFVTAADDLAGANSAREVARRLALVDESGALFDGPFTIIEFETPSFYYASPINRANPGFIGGGATSGGAREFVVPNIAIEDLVNATVREVL